MRGDPRGIYGSTMISYGDLLDEIGQAGHLTVRQIAQQVAVSEHVAYRMVRALVETGNVRISGKGRHGALLYEVSEQQVGRES